MTSNLLQDSFALFCRRVPYGVNYIQKCRYGAFKPKKDQTSKQKKITNSDRALEHFDLHYKPIYGDLWPSMRISLLSAKKMSAVMNSFALENTFARDFISMGGYDIVEQAYIQQSLIISKEKHMNVQLDEENKTSHTDSISHPPEKFDSEEAGSDSYMTKNITEADRQDLDRTNLYAFIPAKTVYSETQELKLEEAKKSVFTPMDIKVEIVKPKPIDLPLDLCVMSFPAGDVTEFPDIKADKPNGLLCYYLMDASSVLPVIALDLQQGDNVLDLCAAPGGKALTLLQTRLPVSLTCNDKSWSRLSRLRSILRYYLPEENRDTVKVTKKSGLDFKTPEYNKVLVDVPCNMDRHVLLVDENNLFNPRRLQERVKMPDLQKDLLLSGIQSCRPGGCVVYSTCTLSPSQNDGVVQSALDELWRESDIQVEVEDLSEIRDIFKDTFRFYNSSRFGQLVIPSLSSNFGPMYFCRIKRLS